MILSERKRHKIKIVLLKGWLNECTPEQQEIFHSMYSIDDMSIDDIDSAIELSKNQVWTNKLNAKQDIIDKLTIENANLRKALWNE